MINKRGLSDIIATVLIILLALAAVVIVWSFVRPTIESGGRAVDLSSKCLEAESKPVACDTVTESVTVQLTKGNLAEINNITAIVEKTDGTRFTSVDSNLPSGVFGTAIKSFGGGDIIAGDKIKTAIIVKNTAGQTYTCSESTFTITCAA